MTDSLEERQAKLDAIAEQIVACTNCPLHKGRAHTVPGSGPANADIMFIGEAPGFYEDQQGLPFVGASGKYLDELLAGVGLSRKNVFISNVVKCRPPSNRDPLKHDLEACEDYLNRQIAARSPKFTASLSAKRDASTIRCSIRRRPCVIPDCARRWKPT